MKGDYVNRFTSMFSVLTVVFMLFTVLGLAHIIFLQFVFPTLVPFHGGGEPITLNTANNYTYQIPWEAYSRLHLSLQTNGTVDLYSNSKYLCKCTSYDFIIEPDDYILVTLKSDFSVSGRFTAWQETPIDKQALGFAILVVGFTGLGISVIALKSEEGLTKRLTSKC
jgi:hypothetical protein